MNSMGMKLTIRTAGAWVPAMIAIEPRTAAMVYAGAVESTPMATPSQNPTAPLVRPLLSRSAACDAGACCWSMS